MEKIIYKQFLETEKDNVQRLSDARGINKQPCSSPVII